MKRTTNTTYQIQDNSNPTTTKSLHRIHNVKYYPMEEILNLMIENYVPVDRRKNDFFERFMEQRYQKLNNTEQPSIADFRPFTIEPFRTVPTALPRKRISSTSSDSGVISSHLLAPSMPVTPDNFHNLQPYPMSSTFSRDLVSVSPSRLQFNNSLTTVGTTGTKIVITIVLFLSFRNSVCASHLHSTRL